MEHEQDAKHEGFTLEIKGPNMNFDKKIGWKVANHIIGVATGLIRIPDSRMTLTGNGEPDGGELEVRDPDLRDFVLQHRAMRNPDKIVAIAVHYFQDQERVVETVSGARIIQGFRYAGFKPPSNFARDLRWTISNGWMAPTDEADKTLSKLVVTEEGFAAVKEKFSDEVKAGTPLPRGGDSI